MAMNCADCEQLLDSFLDGQLSGALRLEFEAHRLRCPRCRQTVAMLESIGNIVACDRTEPPLSANFTDGVMAAIQAAEASKRLKRRRLALWTVGAAQAAAAVAFILWVRAGVTDVQPDKAAPPPRVSPHAADPEFRENYALVIGRLQERLGEMQAAGETISSDFAALTKYAEVPVPRDVARTASDLSGANPFAGLLLMAISPEPAPEEPEPSPSGQYSL